MEHLVTVNRNGGSITTSVIVASVFEKEHSKVCRAIESLSCSEEFRTANFVVSSYVGMQGKRLRMYEITRNGFLSLVKGYKGEKVREFNEKFNAEFDKQDTLIINDDLILTPEMKMQQLRRQKILELAAKKNKSIAENLNLNMLVLEGADSILNKLGKECIVVSKKRRNHKLGYCYKNAANLTTDNYGYVEGYAMNKNTGFRTAHAWNVDCMGNHFDTTFRNAEEYDYFGVIIPESVVYQIGAENGYIWFAALPFIDNLEFNQ